jgi:2-oxoisovalerate dehydrogenase E2 component (dihydrolipoyl transacylase)
MARHEQFRLPDVGEGLTEGEILRWFVAVGDTIVVNQTIVEIETAKAAVELPSPYAGRVTALLVEAGQTVDVGTPIITIDTDPDAGSSDAPGDDPGDAVPAAASPDAAEAIDPHASEFVPTPKPEREAVLVGYGVMSASASRRPRRPGGGSARPVQPTRHGGLEVGRAVEAALADAPAGPAPVRGRAKPPVRKLAKDLGVDLTSVPASGPDGTVTRGDVESYAGAGLATYAPVVVTPAGGERREPVKGVRKLMAEAMVRSAFTIPHVTEWVEVDVTRSVKLVGRLRETPGFSQARVSPLLLVARAVLLAMKASPDINAVWDDVAQEVVYKDYVNLGVAAATPRGLVVPNIKSAERLSLPELALALQDLVATAKAGRTTPLDMAGGTFTITNIGVFGIDGGTPIINPGEGAILAVGAFREKPWVHKGRVRVRWVAGLTLSFDHRFIDGAAGSRFLADVAAVLHDPAVPPLPH